MAMYVERSAFRPPVAKEDLTVEERYDVAFRRLAKALVYQDLSPEQLDRRIDLAMDDNGLMQRNEQRQGMEMLRHLAEAMQAHEAANALFFGGWQEVLAQEARPEQLTRAQVAERFAAFPDREALVESEEAAIEAYTALLNMGGDVDIPLSRNITIRREDIAMLVNDLKTRAAERITDVEERTAALEGLDEELTDIISGFTEEGEEGIQLELKELFLLRRLVHARDVGHLVSVEHASIREDLRLDREKVDIRVAAAGEAFPLQIKTLKGATHKEGREEQARVVKEARKDLEGTGTQLVVLERQSVRDAYAHALRETRWVTVLDTYDALHPLMELPSFSPQQRERLLFLMGMTEGDLVREKEARAQRYAELRVGQTALRLREEAVQTYLREAEEAERREKAARRAEVDAQAAERIRQRQTTVEQRRTAAVRRAQKGIAEAEQRQQEEAARTAIKAKEAREHEKRSAIAKRAVATRKEKEASGWPPKTFQGLVTPPLLQRFGLLPNKLFKQLFQSPDALQHPSQEALVYFSLPEAAE